MVLLELFLVFVQIGFTSFGGMSMVPLINAEMLSHGWMTAAEVSDIVAIAEMTPGPLGLNCATFAGLRVAGMAGSLFANLGVLTPTLTLTFLAAFFLEKFKDSRTLGDAMYGVRPAVLGMIVGTLITLGAQSYVIAAQPYVQTILIGCAALVMLMKLKWNIPATIAACAALGLLLVRE